MPNHRGRGRLDNDIPSFSEWIDRYERQQTEQSQQISSLARDVSSLTADVRSLMKNQEALFTKTSRPFQWSAFIAALALVATSAALLITPMKEQDVRHQAFDEVVMRYMLEDQRQVGKFETELKWLEKLEKRSNERLHQRFQTE